MINARNHILKVSLTCVIASFLLWIAYLLLRHLELGSPAECVFMAQVCVVLLTATYLAADAVHTGFFRVYFNASGVSSTAHLLALTAISSGRWLLRELVLSQIPVLCWGALSTSVTLFITDLQFTAALEIFAILVIYSLAAGAVGMLCAQVFRDTLFGTECATLFWCVLIGGAFLLNPLQRYVDDPQPFISVVLHLNPLIAVQGIFEGLDIFRNPMLYERTPVTSYDYRYPNPWYLVGVWQLVIGGCCFVGAWWMCRYRGYKVQGHQKG
ncbi:MAG: hypothetical protein OXL96_11365 [Candidatus Poribacteria bacterium]|nr:hypothetical protein [Candidatus Poribacteria bacterium]